MDGTNIIAGNEKFLDDDDVMVMAESMRLPLRYGTPKAITGFYGVYSNDDDVMGDDVVIMM